MRAIICGGREYDNYILAWRILDKLAKRYNINHVIEGGARGADTIARRWAKKRKIKVSTENADWDRYGKKAGYIRNKKMRDVYKPKLVIAMPGGIGTNMMIDLAKEKNIKVIKIDLKGWRELTTQYEWE